MESALYRLEEVDFYPVIPSYLLAQAHCPLKSLFILREGANFSWRPGTNYGPTLPDGRRIRFQRYNQYAQAFEDVLTTILATLHVENRISLASSNPLRNWEWRNWVEDLLSAYQHIPQSILTTDILAVLGRKYDSNDLERYIDHPRLIKYKVRVFNPRCRLSNTLSTTTNGQFSFRGPFPIIGEISEIDFRERIITDYFFHRDDHLAEKPDYAQNTLIADNQFRRERIVYLPRITHLWIIRNAIQTLDLDRKRNRSFDILNRRGEEILSEDPDFQQEVLSSTDFDLILETPQERRDVTTYQISGDSVDMPSFITNGLVYFCQTVNAELNIQTGIWSHDRPCTTLKDPHCNLFIPCVLKRGQIIPDSTKIGIKPWLSALVQELTLRDLPLYRAAAYLPNQLIMMEQSGGVIISRFIEFVTENHGNPTIRIDLISQGLLEGGEYLLPEWTYFFGQVFRGRVDQIEDNEATFRLSNHPNMHSLHFEDNQVIFLFPRDPWIDGLRWQQQELFKAMSHKRVRSTADANTMRAAWRERRREGGSRLSDATYGENEVDLI